jgi:probable HAF family extracellular repeat protein
MTPARPLCLVVLLALVATPTQAASLYAIRDLGRVENLKLNASGDVAGTRRLPAGYHETWVSRGGVETIEDPGYSSTSDGFRTLALPLHLADDGRLITTALPEGGYDYRGRGPNGHPFPRWRLDPPTAANDRGELVGMQQGLLSRNSTEVGKGAYRYTPPDGSDPAWSDRARGAFDDYRPALDSPNGARVAETYPNAINDQGVVAGAYLRRTPASPDGRTPEGYSTRAYVGDADIGTLPGGTRSVAWDVNEKGHAVGESDAAGWFSPHAILYRDGELLDLGTLVAGSKYYRSSAKALNNLDQVVGSSLIAGFPGPYSETRAFLYDPAIGRMQNLNDLIDRESGWLLAEAIDINDAGQILGHGYRQGDNIRRGFLLTPGPAQPAPVPEPSTLAVLVAAAAALIRRHRRPC